MSKLNPLTIGLASGITVGIISILCFISVAILPLNTIISLGNSLTHGMDISNIMRKEISAGSLIIGAVSWFILAGLVGYIFALVYNRLDEKHKV